MMDPDEIFSCVYLKCRLSRKNCAERFVRAETLRSDGDGGWRPPQWASFAFPCKGCKIGAAHASVCEVVCPKPTKKAVPFKEKKAQKKCVCCSKEFVSRSNRQKWCSECSPSKRFRKTKSAKGNNQ